MKHLSHLFMTQLHRSPHESHTYQVRETWTRLIYRKRRPNNSSSGTCFAFCTVLSLHGTVYIWKVLLYIIFFTWYILYTRGDGMSQAVSTMIRARLERSIEKAQSSLTKASRNKVSRRSLHTPLIFKHLKNYRSFRDHFKNINLFINPLPIGRMSTNSHLSFPDFLDACQVLK